jgi:hypothetical protein
MKPIAPLALLARTDKWYLGGGNRLVWTPLFPVWLGAPGFWDPAHYYNLEHGPVFTWTLLDEEGAEIALLPASRRWDPAKLTSKFAAADRTLRVTERKCLLPCDVLSSSVRIVNGADRQRRLHLVGWTAQPHYPAQGRTWLSEIGVVRGDLAFARHAASDSRPEFRYFCAMGASERSTSYAVQLSEGAAPQPRWDVTPFTAKFRRGALPRQVRLSGVTDEGQVYMAVHVSVTVPARGEAERSLFFAAAPTPAEARSNLRRARTTGDPVRASEMSWNDYFSGVPSFRCSDEYLTRYYYYRWYGLRLLSTHGRERNYPYPSVSEGIGYFRAPISYSAFCHMLENRWRHDPALARGSLQTFLHNQRADGAFRGYIDPDYYRRDALGEPFYHANWGKALLALNAIHPDAAFLSSVYFGLASYARYFDRERDAESSGLYDIDNHYETGQEYMHRYMAVDPNADRDNWGEVFRLKGVDVSVYLYELKRALAEVAPQIGRPARETAAWTAGAERTKKAILRSMWDPRAEMFFDIDPATGKRTGVKAATCFYPYMTDIAGDRHTPGLIRHLLSPEEFWTAVPAPSSSVDDPYFSAEGEWKGKRMNCPWNGRVWPMTNSHIAEALAETARRSGDARLARAAGSFVASFVRMLFHGGDPGRPNCFEHYHPFTGEPSAYRGVDDYQHSWVNDLILQHAAGVHVRPGSVELRPLPLGLASLDLDHLLVAGRMLRLRKRGPEWTVWLDGTRCYRGKLRSPAVIRL